MNKLTIKQLIAVFGAITVTAMVLVAVLIWQNMQQLEAVLERNQNLLLPILSQGYEARINTIQVQQWLTDISATRAEDGLDDGFSEARAAYDDFQSNLQSLVSLDSDNRDFYTSIRPVFEDYYSAGKAMANAYINEGTAAGNRTMGEFDGTAEAINEKMAEVQDHLLEIARHDNETANRALAEHNQLILFSLGGLLVLLVTLFVVIHRKVAVPARLIADKLSAIAAGDLTGRLSYCSKDELGVIADASRSITLTYQDFITKIIGSANLNSSYSYALLFSVQDAVRFVEQQTQESMQVIREVEELCSSTDDMQTALKKAQEETHGARTQVNDSRTTLEEARSTVDEMSSQLQLAEDAMNTLAGQTQTINNVVATISSIAEQTNLLALNAAIEAARAGDQGRGFAVVADEVRALAQRTQESTSEIRSTIDALQKQSANAVAMINNSRKVAGRNADVSEEVISSLQAIFAYIESIYELNQTVNHLSGEQLQDINKIRERSGNIDGLSSAVRTHILRADRFSNQMRESIKAFTKVSTEVKID